MVRENFNTIGELYKHVLPALKSKVRELKNLNLTGVEERDIWNYLKNNKWCGETDLTLFDIVNDILFTPEKEIINYLSSTNRLKDELKENKESNHNIGEDTILWHPKRILMIY